jgi:NADH-quinone oxidoreductase subunit J
MTELVLFFLFGALAIVGALAVVFAKNPVRSAMGLILTMLSLAVFYVVQSAYFVAAVQVIVYAGAVMTLFLFVIMLIGVDRSEDLKERIPWQRPMLYVLGLVVLGVVVAILIGNDWSWVTGVSNVAETPVGSAEAIGAGLFSDWVLPFEATSLLLIVAAVGAIALAYFPAKRRERE